MGSSRPAVMHSFCCLALGRSSIARVQDGGDAAARCKLGEVHSDMYRTRNLLFTNNHYYINEDGNNRRRVTFASKFYVSTNAFM
jgi:hypothetical protein